MNSLPRTAPASGIIGASPLPVYTLVMEGLPKQALEEVASYFQVLAEPTRLALLNLLRDGDRNVGELAQLTGSTSANVSRHLTQLMRHGLVARESRGTSVYYRMADASVYQLCDLVCGSLARRFEQAASERAAFLGSAARTQAAAAPAAKPRVRKPSV
jgi:DNA-binding transcriptional ArsR family regulator